MEENTDGSLETLEEIMFDEDRHWGYAKKYHEAVFPKSSLKLAFYRERLKNRMRLFYLKNVRLLGLIFDPIIYTAIFLFGGIARFLDTPETRGKNLMEVDPRSIF